MRINSKGQVTIPKAIREKAGLHPHTEVGIHLGANGEVIIRPFAAAAPNLRAALAQVRGSANARQFKGMDTDTFMGLLRG